MSQRKKNRSR